MQKNGGKYGIISIDGSEKLAFEYTDINYIPLGDFVIASYTQNEKKISKVIDSNIETKIEGTVSEINTSKGYIKMYAADDYKYYNFKFEEKASSSLLTGNNLFLSKKDGKYGFIDKDGNVIVDYIYDDGTEQNASGYAGIKKDGLWGVVDAKGNIIVSPKYNLDKNSKIDFIGGWHLCEDANANYYTDI